MAALVPEKVYVCDGASSVPKSSAVPVASYTAITRWLVQVLFAMDLRCKEQQGYRSLTFTRIVVPNATSNRHSDPAVRLICDGGAGANSRSPEG